MIRCSAPLDRVTGASACTAPSDGGALLLTPRTDARGDALFSAHPDGADGSLALGLQRGERHSTWRPAVTRTRAASATATIPAFPPPRPCARGRRVAPFGARPAALGGARRRHDRRWMARAGRSRIAGPAGTAPAGERQDDGLARPLGIPCRPCGESVAYGGGMASGGHVALPPRPAGLDETARTRTMGVDVDVQRALPSGLQLRGAVSASRATAQHPSLAAHASEGLSGSRGRSELPARCAGRLRGRARGPLRADGPLHPGESAHRRRLALRRGCDVEGDAGAASGADPQ